MVCDAKKWKVLIVDDEELVRNFIEMALKELECEIQVAESGNEGYEKAIEFRPDLIICDLSMPSGSGEVFLRRLRTNVSDYNPHIILTSGYSYLSEKEIKSLGVNKLVSKPFQLDQMRGHIRQVLGLD